MVPLQTSVLEVPSVSLAGGEFSLMRILPLADVSEQKKVQTITVPAGRRQAPIMIGGAKMTSAVMVAVGQLPAAFCDGLTVLKTALALKLNPRPMAATSKPTIEGKST